MPTDPQIIPAILATGEDEYREKLKKIESSGLFDNSWVQIDLMDNKFVQNKSISPQVLGKYPTALKIEAHLMVDHPDNWVDELIKVGVQRIIFPVETGERILGTLEHIKNQGVEAGLALNPETVVEKVEPFIGKIDVVLLMSVHPGFGGQKFLPETLDKIKKLSRLKERGSFLVEVDGGIGEDVAKDLVGIGADGLVIGEHLINGDIAENLEKIWESLRA